MKVRLGFVSNSSSSSFMVITSRVNFFNVAETVKMKPDGYKEILEAIITPTKKIDGVDMVSFWRHCDSGEYYYSNTGSYDEEATDKKFGVDFNEFASRLLAKFRGDKNSFYESFDW